MAANYPSSLPVKEAAGANLSTNPHSSLHNNMYDEIVAIATELGTAPKGAAASVKSRLDNLDLLRAESTVTTIVPIAGWSLTLNMRLSGRFAAVSVVVERTGANVGATTAALGTIDAAGRGSFSGFAQALSMRSRTGTAQDDSMCYIQADTGVVTVQWLATWNTSATATYTGILFMGA